MKNDFQDVKSKDQSFNYTLCIRKILRFMMKIKPKYAIYPLDILKSSQKN